MRRFTQLSLRSLFAIVTLCCVFALWVSQEVRRYRAQTEAIERMLARTPNNFWVRTTQARPHWFWKLVAGKDATDVEIASFSYSDSAFKRAVGILPEEAAQVASWRQAKDLLLGGPAIDDELLASFSGMRQLAELWIVDANVSSSGIARLRDLPRLTYLRFDQNHRVHAPLDTIGKDAIEAMARFPKLEKLTFIDYKLDHAAVRALPRLERLNYLVLMNAGLNDEDMAVLARMPRLELLHLDDSSEITNASVELFPQLVSLKELSLRGTQLTVDGFLRLIELCPRFDPNDPNPEELMVTPSLQWEVAGRRASAVSMP